MVYRKSRPWLAVPCCGTLHYSATQISHVNCLGILPQRSEILALHHKCPAHLLSGILSSICRCCRWCEGYYWYVCAVSAPNDVWKSWNLVEVWDYGVLICSGLVCWWHSVTPMTGWHHERLLWHAHCMLPVAKNFSATNTCVDTDSALERIDDRCRSLPSRSARSTMHCLGILISLSSSMWSSGLSSVTEHTWLVNSTLFTFCDVY